jgi:hypothetical protein
LAYPLRRQFNHQELWNSGWRDVVNTAGVECRVAQFAAMGSGSARWVARVAWIWMLAAL